MIVAVVGGFVAILVIRAEGAFQNEWGFLILVMVGILPTLIGCKLFRVPYIAAMIGGITFILVVTRTDAGASVRIT